MAIFDEERDPSPAAREWQARCARAERENEELRSQLAAERERREVAERKEHMRCVELLRTRGDKNVGSAGEWAEWLSERGPK